MLHQKLRALVRATLAALVVAFAVSPANAQYTCDQLYVYYEGSSWWWGAFGNCKKPGGPTTADAAFDCAWAQVQAAHKTDCLRGKLRNSPSTTNGINAVLAANKPATPPPPPTQTCDQLFTYYEGSSWWWGAFGNCKKPGGPTTADAAFECAWAQVQAAHKTDCLKGKLRPSASTTNGINAVLAANAPPVQTCDQLFTYYEGSAWWWGAFGNCKKPGGPTTPDPIFDCAWAQVQAPHKTDCLKGKLRTSTSTTNGINAVVAANTPPNVCDQLFAKYENSAWWWGAFGNCKKAGGPTTPDTIFECAWAQVPANEKDACLKTKLRPSASTKKGIDAVFAQNGFVFGQAVSENPPAEACSETGAAHVPKGYFLVPNDMTDAQSSNYNDPAGKGLNIGTNEGRIRAEFRAAAKKADPVNDLATAAFHFASAATATEKGSGMMSRRLGNAFADLSVTGRAAFAKFEASTPSAEQIVKSMHDRAACAAASCDPKQHLCIAGCPPASRFTDTQLTTGANTAIDRAFDVANVLRAGNMFRGSDGKPAIKSERSKLDWIAVSGEDDQPYRPVNVPSSKSPQFDITITMGTQPVRTRYVIHNTKGETPTIKIPTGRQLAKLQKPQIASDSEVILFIHGMDSRAEEAEDLADALRAVSNRSFVVISLDLPTSGYGQNLDHCVIPNPNPNPATECKSLFALGDPKEPPQWFDAHGKQNAPLLDFIENFIVAFVDKLDGEIQPAGLLKQRFKAVVGGSLGGNMSLRLGRRANVPWIKQVVPWSPASVWISLAEGPTVTPTEIVENGTKHGGVRAGWQNAGGNALNLPETIDARRKFFYDAFDQAVLGGLVTPAQANMWFSDRFPCKRSALVGARLDRHETYNRDFRLWHWRLGTEQLIFSHVANDAAGKWLFLGNTKKTMLMCGKDDDFKYTNICSSTQWIAQRMTTTPGRALFLDWVGHSIDVERPQWFARKVAEFIEP